MFDNVAAIMCMWLGDTDYISVHLYTTPQLFWAQIYDWVRYSQTMFRMGQVCLFCATNLFFVFSLERLSYLNKIPPWINHKHWTRNWKIWAVYLFRWNKFGSNHNGSTVSILDNLNSYFLRYFKFQALFQF